MNLRHVCIALLLAGVALGANAQNSGPSEGSGPGGQGQGMEPGGGGGDQQHRRPPPEALDACQGKASGAACSFTGRRDETVSGTCFAPQSDLPLACRPAQRGGGKGQVGTGSSGQAK